MIRETKPGAPLPFGDALFKPDLVVTEAGNFDGSDGVRIVLSGGHLVFMAAFDNTQIVLGVDVDTILDAIQRFTRKNAQA